MNCQKMEKTVLNDKSSTKDTTRESTLNSKFKQNVQSVAPKESENSYNLVDAKEALIAENMTTEHPEDSELKTLSHTELKRFFQGALSQLLCDDPILTDLHPQVTLEEVNALIELEHGRAMKIYIEKADEGFWSVVIPREASVYELKQALKHHVALVLSRKGVKKKISWRHVWKTYWLSYNGEKLSDDNTKLIEYGIKNKSHLTFMKKYRERQQFGKRSMIS
ncbi:U11/U12 small nuclear ribonucleoprotein 25 kDa protein isoform X2 [Procambarus clarkii]|uniref:U11/U12 small nuclear ribonucleoprotein 25 kDa protein isoform X2 n=1 Tax=Procambarus clarkii TaxID=6728 RepID=UPI003742AE69